MRRLALCMILLLPPACGGEGEPQQGGGGPPATAVATIEAREADVPIRVEGVGGLRANQMALIAPEMSGVVASIEFEDGQRVEKGEPLFTLINDEERADLAAARAELRQKQWVYQQTLQLSQNNAASEFEVTQDRLDREAAEARVQQTQAALAKTRIRAPFRGSLGVRRHDVGDFLSSGQAMVRLIQDNPMLVDYRLSGQYAQQVRTGQPILVYGKEGGGVASGGGVGGGGAADDGGGSDSAEGDGVDSPSSGGGASGGSEGGDRFDGGSGSAGPSNGAGSDPTGPAGDAMPLRRGRAIAMSPGIDPSTRSIRVRGRLPNPRHKLTSGRFVRVEQELGVRRDAVLIPQEAVVRVGGEGGGAAVFTIEGGKARRVPIALGQYIGSEVIVVRGLRAGRRIVLTGAQKLSEGAAVREAKAKPIRRQTTEPMQPAAGVDPAGAGRNPQPPEGRRPDAEPRPKRRNRPDNDKAAGSSGGAQPGGEGGAASSEAGGTGGAGGAAEKGKGG